jgi:two-component system, OmpR family, sensor histidine kinase KdpD
MTRLEAGAIVPERQSVDLGEVIGSAVRRAASLLGHHAVEIKVDPDLPLLDLDPSLVEHVLVNLLDNAAKYAPEDSTIAIRGRRDTGDIAVEVVDEGPGLPPGGFEWVFERFRRACPDGKPHSGTGLGLAICRGFVEALGGRIQARNREDGTGAVFTITFPQALVSVAKADHP